MSDAHAPKTGAVIVAAGRGLRAGGGIPKQWRDLGGRPVAAHAMEVFAAHPGVSDVVLVVHPDDLSGLPPLPPAQIVAGGETRGASVLAGLEALDDMERVLIHDAARPGVTVEIIDAVLGALDDAPAAAPALPVTDALWRGAEEVVAETVSRDGLWRAQTPQGFHFDAILAAHRAFPGMAADDVEVARAAGMEVRIVPGSERNMKITEAADFDRAARLMGGAMDIRLGNGFDVHRFGDGDHVMLCGVALPHERGLAGHSDADVGMHAVTDAIYGALGDGDIGRHFPPSDPQWKGAESRIFLAHAAERARAAGYRISHLDCTLICEQPKIGPHAAAMAEALAAITGIEPGRVSVKATTSERLGFTGREEGIAALATATLVKG